MTQIKSLILTILFIITLCTATAKVNAATDDDTTLPDAIVDNIRDVVLTKDNVVTVTDDAIQNLKVYDKYIQITVVHQDKQKSINIAMSDFDKRTQETINDIHIKQKQADEYDRKVIRNGAAILMFGLLLFLIILNIVL